jgi:type I restriction-modification system DNA methylase subunit
MTMRQKYQQFFTPKKYSQVIINLLEDFKPNTIIDLAMGEGSLLIEAKKKWAEAEYYGNDIDRECCKQLIENYSDINIFNYDIFLNPSIDNIKKEIKSVDLCIGNPPFYKIKLDNEIKILLKEFNLEDVCKSEHISSEVPFILQCLKILKKDGVLALILPDGFFTNNCLKYFREFIVSNYQIDKILELPENIFEYTKAKTHIMILKNRKPTDFFINLYAYNENSISIDRNEAINRMDYSYYKSIDNSCDEMNTLKNLDVELFRGRPKYKIEDIDKKYILHSTSFKLTKGIFTNRLKSVNKIQKHEDKIAKKNDIVLVRVGSSCLGNIGMVERGYFVITDCIFVIRVKDNNLRKIIYHTLKSEIGQKWIQSHAKGVAARHITLEEIAKFPINKKAIHGI